MISQTQLRVHWKLNSHFFWLSFIFLLLSATSISFQSHGEEAGMNIIGDQEAPTVLNVVPWKTSERTSEPKELEAPSPPSSSMMQPNLKPLDKEELMREVEYFNKLNAAPQATAGGK